MLTVSCGNDEPTPNNYIGEWILEGSFYGETEYKITFLDNESYKRVIVDIPGGFGTFNDAGTYVISGENLIFQMFITYLK